MKGLIFLVTLMLQAGAVQTEPAGWRDIKNKAMDLSIAGRDIEVVALCEKFLAQYPNFAEAHMMLGAAHEQVARGAVRSGAADPLAVRAKHYDAAITEMRRGLELAGNRASFDWMRGLIDIHGIVGVDRPAEYERLVREAVTKYPAEPHAHAYLLYILANKGQSIDVAAKAARAAIPRTADARVDLAASVASFVNDYRRIMPASGVTALLVEASSLVDEALTLQPGNRDALRTRADIERLRKPPQ